MRHLDELRVLADHQKRNILAINETKIDDKISDQEMAIDGYYLYMLCVWCCYVYIYGAPFYSVY